MRYLITLALLSLLLSPARADTPAAPASTWKPPEQWLLRVETFAPDAKPGKQYPLFVSVSGLARVGEADCWMVIFGPDASNPGPVDRQFWVWIDKETSWPRKVSLHTNNDHKTTPLADNLRDGTMVPGGTEGFPIEIFPIDGSLTKTIPDSSLKLVITREEVGAGKRFVVEARVMNEESEELRVRQTWVAGEKWWREYERYVRGQLILKATRDAPPPAITQDPETVKFFGRTQHLRDDPRLATTLSVVAVDVALQEIVNRVQGATGVPLGLDPALERHDPQFGDWQLRDMPAWRFMDIVSQVQLVDGRWVKDGDGYRLIARASLREKSQPPTITLRQALTASMIVLGLIALCLFLVRPGMSRASGLPADELHACALDGSALLVTDEAYVQKFGLSAELSASIRELEQLCFKDPANIDARRALRRLTAERKQQRRWGNWLASLWTIPVRARIGLARCLRRPASVLYWGEKLVGEKPRAMGTHCRMARAAETLGQIDLAIWLLGKARQEDARSLVVNRELARLCETQGLTKEAGYLWRTVALLAPVDVEAQFKARDMAALHTIAQNAWNPMAAVDSSRPAPASPRAEGEAVAGSSGEMVVDVEPRPAPPRAIGRWLRLVASAPARLRLRIARSLRRHKSVIYWGERVLLRNPGATVVSLQMAAAAERLGKLDLAVFVLRQAREQNRTDVRINRELARLCEERGLHQQARHFWSAVAAAAPHDIEAQQKVRDMAALVMVNQGLQASACSPASVLGDGQPESVNSQRGVTMT